MIEGGSLGFLAEFWPWLSTLTLYYVDRYLGGWLDWLFLPYLNYRKYIWIFALLLFIILPLVVVTYIYLSVIALYLFRRRKEIISVIREQNSVACRVTEIISSCWNVHANIWHKYQVHGANRITEITKNGKGCMVVYYHGAMPIDVYYLTCWLRVNLRVCARPVVDYFMFKVPGFRDFLENFGATTGPRENLAELLKKGNVVIISPGGVREALFSKDYEIIWEKRDGFAKCAIEAGVPILPMFTSNVRQVFDFPERLKGATLRALYEYTRLPFSLLFGFFPVKLDTHIGPKIDTTGISVDECRKITKF